jgi:hypothetical protein
MIEALVVEIDNGREFAAVPIDPRIRFVGHQGSRDEGIGR